MEEPELPDEGCELPDISQEYFEKIISLCREHDIQLILYAAPYGYENEEGYERYVNRQKINITLEAYLEKKARGSYNKLGKLIERRRRYVVSNL